MLTAGEEIASLYQREREPELRERRALVERARALERGDRAADVQAAQEHETEHAMRVTERRSQADGVPSAFEALRRVAEAELELRAPCPGDRVVRFARERGARAREGA